MQCILTRADHDPFYGRESGESLNQLRETLKKTDDNQNNPQMLCTIATEEEDARLFSSNQPIDESKPTTQ